MERFVACFARPGDAPFAVTQKSIWVAVLAVVAVLNALCTALAAEGNWLAVVMGATCGSAAAASLGCLLWLRRLPAWFVMCLAGLLLVNAAWLDLAMMPMNRRGWVFLVVALQVLVAVRVPLWVGRGSLVVSAAWAAVAEVELVYRFGMLDLPGTAPYERRGAGCTHPPCGSGAASDAVIAVLVAWAAIFAAAGAMRAVVSQILRHELDVENAGIATRHVASSLATFDVENAAQVLADPAVPDDMAHAFAELLDVLALYRSYLPQSLIPEDHLIEDCTEAQVTEDLPPTPQDTEVEPPPMVLPPGLRAGPSPVLRSAPRDKQGMIKKEVSFSKEDPFTALFTVGKAETSDEEKKSPPRRTPRRAQLMVGTGSAPPLNLRTSGSANTFMSFQTASTGLSTPTRGGSEVDLDTEWTVASGGASKSVRSNPLVHMPVFPPPLSPAPDEALPRNNTLQKLEADETRRSMSRSGSGADARKGSLRLFRPGSKSALGNCRLGSRSLAELLPENRVRPALKKERLTLLVAVLPVAFRIEGDAGEWERYLAMHAASLEAVIMEVKQHKGVVDHFQGGRVFVSYNAFRRNARHAENALLTAHALASLEGAPAPPHADAPPSWQCGLASGWGATGTLGTTSLMRPSVLGTLLLAANDVASVAGLLNLAVVCNGVVAENVSLATPLRLLPHRMEFSFEGRVSAAVPTYGHLYSVESYTNPTEMPDAAKKSSSGGTGEEWMYEMENQPGAKWEHYNDAAKVFIRTGDHEAAGATLRRRTDSAHMKKLLDTALQAARRISFRPAVMDFAVPSPALPPADKSAF